MKARNTLDLPRGKEEEFTAVIGALISNSVWCLVWDNSGESTTTGKSKNGVKHDSRPTNQTKRCENPRAKSRRCRDSIRRCRDSIRIKALSEEVSPTF
jgi:hypothetical protein